MDLSFDGADTIIADFGDKPSLVTKAMVRALNRSINSGRTVMVREIARDTGLKSKDVNTAMRLREATTATPEATLGASLKKIPLIDFAARQTGRGVSYNLGGRRTITGAFIATMPSGHRGVFARTPGKFMRYQKATWHVKRQAIHEKFGPSLGHVFVKYRPAGIARVQEVFAANLAHEMDFANADKYAGARSAVGLDV